MIRDILWEDFPSSHPPSGITFPKFIRFDPILRGSLCRVGRIASPSSPGQQKIRPSRYSEPSRSATWLPFDLSQLHDSVEGDRTALAEALDHRLLINALTHRGRTSLDSLNDCPNCLPCESSAGCFASRDFLCLILFRNVDPPSVVGCQVTASVAAERLISDCARARSPRLPASRA